MAEGTEVETKWFVLMLGLIFLVFVLSYLPFIVVNQVPANIFQVWIDMIQIVISTYYNLNSCHFVSNSRLLLYQYHLKFDSCYTKPYLHVFAYVINWTSVVVNPVVYVVMQKSYQVRLTVSPHTVSQ